MPKILAINYIDVIKLKGSHFNILPQCLSIMNKVVTQCEMNRLPSNHFN